MTQPKRTSEASGLTPTTATAPLNWQAALAEHSRWLRAVILARLGEPQAVDEVLQEVCLAAVRQKSPIADRSKIAPWLYRLAVRQTLLFRRKRGRQRNLVHRFADEFRPTEAGGRDADPLGWLLSEERRQMVQLALKKLPHGDAEILLLKYTEGWNYQEIAERLGVSHSAVETRLHRARARLRAELTAVQVIEV